MEKPKLQIVTDGDNSAVFYMPDDVASALTFLYLDLEAGRITEKEYYERADKLLAANRKRIGMIKNIGG